MNCSQVARLRQGLEPVSRRRLPAVIRLLTTEVISDVAKVALMAARRKSRAWSLPSRPPS